MPIFVYICITKSNISSILLHYGFCKSSKRLEIIKSLNIIIMSIPKRNLSNTFTRRGRSKYPLPLIIGWINSYFLTFGFDCIDDLCQKIAVTCGIMPWPWTSRTGICLNIDPYCWIRSRWYITYNIIYLRSWAFSSAWKYVYIRG